jgi:hypothetical protein
MKLTGKTKEAFFKFTIKNYGFDEYAISHLKDTLKNALIIEFFDSVGYTIDRDSYNRKMTIVDWNDGNETHYTIDCEYLDPFTDWWDKAIEKANELLNKC